MPQFLQAPRQRGGDLASAAVESGDGSARERAEQGPDTLASAVHLNISKGYQVTQKRDDGQPETITIVVISKAVITFDALGNQVVDPVALAAGLRLACAHSPRVRTGAEGAVIPGWCTPAQKSSPALTNGEKFPSFSSSSDDKLA